MKEARDSRGRGRKEQRNQEGKTEESGKKEARDSRGRGRKEQREERAEG